MTTSSSPEKHIAAAKRRLVHLSGLAATTEAHERKILGAARSRKEAIETDLKALKPRAIADASAGERYLELTQELGQVDLVIARARKALS